MGKVKLKIIRLGLRVVKYRWGDVIRRVTGLRLKKVLITQGYFTYVTERGM